MLNYNGNQTTHTSQLRIADIFSLYPDKVTFFVILNLYSTQMELYAKKKDSCKPLKQSFIQFCYHLASTLVYARKADAFHLIIFHGCANYQSQTTTMLMKQTIVFQLVKTKRYF